MVTLPAKLMAIHLPAFEKQWACTTSASGRCEQRVNTSSKGLLSISVSSSSTEGRAQSYSLEYETSARKMTSSCTERRIHCQRGDVLMGTSLCRQGEQRVSILWTGGLSGPVLHEEGIDWVSK